MEPAISTIEVSREQYEVFMQYFEKNQLFEVMVGPFVFDYCVQTIQIISNGLRTALPPLLRT